MRTIHLVFLVVSLSLFTAFAQGQDSLSAVKQAVDAKYSLTKTTADRTGIVAAGSVLVLRKDNLVTGDANGTLTLGNTYKGGKITQGLMGHMASGTSGTRTFVAGEKLWVTNIDVNNKGVVFTLFSDAYPDLHYKATLSFPFAKGMAPSPADALAIIGEVFETDGSGHETANGSAAQPVSGNDQKAGGSVAGAQVADNTPWNPKYGRLTSDDLQRINQASVRFDVNYFRLNPSTLDQKAVMQYFIALNNCNNPEIGRALANELDYPALAEYYKAKAPAILAPLPRTVRDVTLYRTIGGYSSGGWKLWSQSLSLGEYNVQRAAFPIKYPGKDNVGVSGSLSTEANGRNPGDSCPTAGHFAGPASAYLPGTYTISIQPMSFKELPMDQTAARAYIDKAGPQRAVFLALDVTPEDTPPTISHIGNNALEAIFQARVARIRVINSISQQFVGTLYDDHSVTDAQAAPPAPPPPSDPQKRGSQWAASDHLYQIRRAVYVWLAADACPDWPISAEQSANLKRFLQSAQNGKFNDREQYYTTDTVVRNAIARQGRANYCANPMERRDYEKALTEIAPVGPIGAPAAK